MKLLHFHCFFIPIFGFSNPLVFGSNDCKKVLVSPNEEKPLITKKPSPSFLLGSEPLVLGEIKMYVNSKQEIKVKRGNTDLELNFLET